MTDDHTHQPQYVQGQPYPYSAGEKPASQTDFLLICFFLGGFGIHRFMTGKIGTAVLMLLTGGGLGIWVLVDFIRIFLGKFSYRDGRAIPREPKGKVLGIILISVWVLALLIFGFFFFLSVNARTAIPTPPPGL
jgi:hypothetical protein